MDARNSSRGGRQGALPLQKDVFAKKNLTTPNWIEVGQKMSLIYQDLDARGDRLGFLVDTSPSSFYFSKKPGLWAKVLN